MLGVVKPFRAVPGTRLKLICDRFLTIPRLAVDECTWREETEAQEIAAADVGISWIPDDDWSRGLYRVVDDNVEGKGVRHGQLLCDVSLSKPNETTELHNMTSAYEPIDVVKVRPVFVLEDGTERKAG